MVHRKSAEHTLSYGGDLGCDTSAVDCVNAPDPFACTVGDMPQIPGLPQNPRTITDMHASPCVMQHIPVDNPYIGFWDCNATPTAPSSSGIAQDHFDAVQSFLDNRAPNNTVIFGEIWSNSPPTYTCDSPCVTTDTPCLRDQNGTQVLAQQTVAGYNAPSRFPTSSGSRVVFRPWENANAPGACLIPAQIGPRTGHIVSE